MNDSTAPLAPSPAPEPAPARARRFASMMYEGVLLFGIVFIAGYLFDTLTQSRHGLTLRHARQVWLFLAIGIYFVVCWRRSGQTLPMKAWNIRLVSATGGRLTIPQMLIRYAGMWVIPAIAALAVWALSHAVGQPYVLVLTVLAPFANFLPTLFVADKQFWHDKIARTQLITTPSGKKSPR